MVGPAGIDQARNLRMLGQDNRDGRGCVGLPAHTHAKRLQAFEQDPCVERRQRRAGLADQCCNVVLNEFFGGEDDTAEATALAVDMFGGGIDHAVGPKLERPLEERGREHVVDDQRRAGCMRDLGDRLDVEYLKRRVRGRFQEECLRVRPHGLAPLIEIGALDQRRGDAVARQVLLDHIKAGAEHRFR